MSDTKTSTQPQRSEPSSTGRLDRAIRSPGTDRGTDSNGGPRS
jgi:hypothetical protein